MVRTLNEIISGDVTDLSKRIEVLSFDETGQMAVLVNRTFEKVAALVKEMLVGSQNVITGSRNIGQITAEVASGMNEMAIGARQITTSANRVNEISRTNNESIETLLAELRRFKV
jgi:methyl-accepting chemotaxis protein